VNIMLAVSIAGVLLSPAAAAHPASSPEPVTPWPLRITSVMPSFGADPGPAFLVTYVNEGPLPISQRALMDAVRIEAGGVTHGRRTGILVHLIPPEIAPGSEGWEYVTLHQFCAPVPGRQAITIVIGGVRSPPVEFMWNPQLESPLQASPPPREPEATGPPHLRPGAADPPSCGAPR
jgi:hypothetical protein